MGGITTLGVGVLVVGLVVDAIVDWVLQELGYDPEAVIAHARSGSRWTALPTA